MMTICVKIMALRFGRSARLLRNCAAFSTKLPIDSRHVTQKLVFSEFGDALKVVRQEEEPLPAPKPNEVVIKMLAAPVNPADINTIQGVYPIKPPLPAIPGNEGVGEIEAMGSEVVGLQKGDRVLPKGVAWGTWRSRAVCDANDLIKIPNQLGVVEAATLSVNPCTAYRMLKDFVKLQPGDTVIQNGANSACGQNVIQMCKAWGINSINIVRNRDNICELRGYLKDLGATYVFTEEEVRAIDLFKKAILPKPRLALNCVGGKNALEMMRHLDQRGTMVTYGGMSRQPVSIPTSSLIFKDIRVFGFWMTRWSTVHESSPERVDMLDDIVQMMVNGQLRPPAHKLVAFNNYKEALSNTLSSKGFTGMKYILDFQKD
ncbi:enoyl-[acyl-carrier-protein] reductase, mitochondrial [Anabrus simplex]|uniref:enoyl-[acyl-carrier-protein] reductase, mitochondrial n=1 Tax=Anabrus simplex TaxID=316456 RepID=UPI0034DD8AB5